MELGEKLRRLREAEGLRRGLWRVMTQREVTRALRQELGVTLSQAYLSQMESGARVHLSSETREALARFYHVRPGDLVNDPPGQTLASLDGRERQLQRMLDQLADALADAPDPERALPLVERLLALPPDALAMVEAALDASPESRAPTDTAKSDPTATSARPRS